MESKYCSVIFFSLFYVCFKCKIRFRTYGIHHNIKIWTKNFTIPRDYEGGGGRGGPDPFIVKDYEKGPFFAALPKCMFIKRAVSSALNAVNLVHTVSSARRAVQKMQCKVKSTYLHTWAPLAECITQRIAHALSHSV